MVRRVVAGCVAVLASTGCVHAHTGLVSIVFDQPMVPEVVGQTFLRCGIHDTPQEADGNLAVWLIPPEDVSQKQLRCLLRQPHVKTWRGAM